MHLIFSFQVLVVRHHSLTLTFTFLSFTFYTIMQNITNTCLDLKIKEISFSCSQDFCHLYLEPPGWQFTPGQFVMLRPCAWERDPLWPSPFSICELTDDYLHIFFQIVGRGTELLSHLT